jgi:AAA family ATP:ADP antiporter
MMLKLVKLLWGDVSNEELKKFGILSLALLFIVGTYWLLRPLKDALFMGIVGKLYLPYAKIGSVLFLVPLVLLYSKLVDIFEKHKLLYIITTCYGIFFICMAFLLMHPTIGLANTLPYKYRILGWTIYLGIESFGSLVVTLFWSFVSSITETSSAKRGYALILAGAQLGAIAGPEFVKHATQIGIPSLVLIAACGTFIVPLIIMIFVRSQSLVNIVAVREKKASTGLTEGLRLLFTRPYLLGILGIATLNGIIATILEFQLNYLAKETYHSTERVAEFLGLYGQSINFLALLLALVGTSFIIRKFGLTFSLVVYPLTVGISVCCVWRYPTLWMLFAAMVALKCLSYALNSPCKEIIYIPTSKDIRFKAKGWIDTFGDRSAKGIGGGVCALFPIMANLVFFGSIISLGIVGIWIAAATYVGRKNYSLVQENKILE